MDVQAFLRSIEQTDFAQWVTTAPLGFRTFEVIHVIAIVLVFGTIAIVDLRLLGIPSSRQSFLEIGRDTLKWTWIAFAVAVVTGIIMFTSRAVAYAENPFFLIKMVLLLLAGINMLVFELITARSAGDWDKDVATPPAAKIAAVLSLLLWLGVIVAGRWIGFHEPAPPVVDVNTLPDIFGGGGSPF